MAQFLEQAIQRAFWQPLGQWLGNHPLINWLVSHPFILLCLCLLILFLFVSLIGAIARATENLWIRILRFPFQAGWSLLRGTVQVTKRVMLQPSTPAIAQLPEQKDPARSPQDELSELLSRLDAIKQEEAELMQQIKCLIQHQVSSKSHHP